MFAIQEFEIILNLIQIVLKNLTWIFDLSFVVHANFDKVWYKWRCPLTQASIAQSRLGFTCTLFLCLTDLHVVLCFDRCMGHYQNSANPIDPDRMAAATGCARTVIKTFAVSRKPIWGWIPVNIQRIGLSACLLTGLGRRSPTWLIRYQQKVLLTYSMLDQWHCKKGEQLF